MAPMKPPLNDLRILDLTNVIMGPYATQVLADLGADVIKVEAPRGDTTRQIPPMRHPAMGTMFLQLNHNKRSVVLDLKQADDVNALVDIAATCDVFLTNVRPAALARLGINRELLAERNPGLIWLSLTGFGEGGEYSGRPAYDDIIQSLTAIPDLLVRAGTDHPHYVPVSLNDRAVGLHAAIALLAAVHQRTVTGQGQTVEVPMYETMAQFILGDHMGGHTFEPPIGPPGYQRTLTPERRPFKTLDGYLCALIYTDQQWRNFFSLIGEPERFENDPRVQTLLSRTEHANVLYREIGEQLARRTTQEWLDALADADIPAAPVHSLESAIYDSHLQQVGFFELTDHPTEGLIRRMRTPTRWSDTEFPVGRPAPSLGEHTEEILREVGVTDDRIRRIARRESSVSEPSTQKG